MTGVLVRDTQRRRPCEGGGRHGSDVATSQGYLKVGRGARAFRRAWVCNALCVTSGPWSNGDQFLLCKPPVCGNMSVQPRDELFTQMDTVSVFTHGCKLHLNFFLNIFAGHTSRLLHRLLLCPF
jgi:hypothetical protein